MSFLCSHLFTQNGSQNSYNDLQRFHTIPTTISLILYPCIYALFPLLYIYNLVLLLTSNTPLPLSLALAVPSFQIALPQHSHMASSLTFFGYFWFYLFFLSNSIFSVITFLITIIKTANLHRLSPITFLFLWPILFSSLTLTKNGH